LDSPPLNSLTHPRQPLTPTNHQLARPTSLSKIRVSLGLKPISSEPSAAKLKEDAAADNFAAHRDDQRQAREAAALKDRIDKARNQKERQRRLIGIGLGDENPVAGAVKAEDDDGGADSRAWVKRQKKRQKELAAKRIKEEEENEKLMAQVANYGEQDLSGLKVLHGQDDFEEGEETILTLKDNRILDDEGNQTSPRNETSRMPC